MPSFELFERSYAVVLSGNKVEDRGGYDWVCRLRVEVIGYVAVADIRTFHVHHRAKVWMARKVRPR